MCATAFCKRRHISLPQHLNSFVASRWLAKCKSSEHCYYACSSQQRNTCSDMLSAKISIKCLDSWRGQKKKKKPRLDFFFTCVWKLSAIPKIQRVNITFPCYRWGIPCKVCEISKPSWVYNEQVLYNHSCRSFQALAFIQCWVLQPNRVSPAKLVQPPSAAY